MLARYTIYRRRPKDVERLPDGIRKDTRWRTSHILRPTKEIVEAFLADTSDAAAWKTFHEGYLALLEERYSKDPAPFEELSELASENDVYIGCNCPTKKNPELRRCHTYLALGFMQEKFPSLEVVFPDES